MPAFEEGKLFVCRQGKLVEPYTRENKLTCQGKLAGKKLCSLYIRASKTTKELVKENLVVCAGHLQDGVRITKIKFWKCLKINSFNKTTLAIYRRFYNLLDR